VSGDTVGLTPKGINGMFAKENGEEKHCKEGLRMKLLSTRLEQKLHLDRFLRNG